MRQNLSQYRLNLADKPFVNMSAPWLAISLLAAVTVLLLALNVYVLTGLSGHNGETSETISMMNTEMDAMRQEINDIDVQLKDFNPAQIRREVTRVNDLIIRRTLSWSKLFDTLEQLAPAELRMVRISPRISGGELQLSFRVVVPRQEVIRNFITALEDSPQFDDVRLSSEVTDINVGQIVWELSTIYNEDVGDF